MIYNHIIPHTATIHNLVISNVKTTFVFHSNRTCKHSTFDIIVIILYKYAYLSCEYVMHYDIAILDNIIHDGMHISPYSQI